MTVKYSQVLKRHNYTTADSKEKVIDFEEVDELQ
jgi:hypothetical protein